MPIYEFQCEKCQGVFSLSMKMADPHPEQCPTCHHSPVTKIMSLTSFQLKGGGWYSDGYGGKKPDVSAASAVPSGTETPAAPATIPAVKTDVKKAEAPAASPAPSSSPAPTPK